MNRILSIVTDTSGKKMLVEPITQMLGQTPTTRPSDAPDACAFCGKSLKRCLLTVWTQPKFHPTAAMCLGCLSANSVLINLTKSFRIWYETVPDYGPLKRSLLKRLFCEEGSPELKSAIADLGIRLLQRSSAILAGCVYERCPKTGVNLALPRIAIISDELNACAELLRIVCREIGLIYRRVTMRQLKTGFAYRNLVDEQCFKQETWAEHAVICCVGVAPPNANSVIVYAALTQAGIPGEVEKIVVQRRQS